MLVLKSSWWRSGYGPAALKAAEIAAETPVLWPMRLR
jgi:hypothetical protein